LLDAYLRCEKDNQDKKFRLDGMTIARVRKRYVVDRGIGEKQEQVEFCSRQSLAQSYQQTPESQH